MIRLTALGDVVLTEPVVRALRSHWPQAELEFLTEARYAPLVEKTLGVKTIGWDRRGTEKGLGGLGRVLQKLGRYDFIIDLQGKLRTRMLTAQLPGRTLTLRKRNLGQGLLALLGHDPPLTDRHATQVYLEVLAPLGITAAPTAPRLRGLGEQVPGRIGLSPGASHATKLWAPEKFAALADRLASPQRAFVLIGGPSDRPLLDEIRSKVKMARIDPLDVASLDVLGAAEVLASLELLITVDTGPAHLAAALGAKVVVLFGPTAPERWGPLGERHRVVRQKLDCMPCSNTGGPRCPLGHHDCLGTLSVDSVLEAVLA